MQARCLVVLGAGLVVCGCSEGTVDASATQGLRQETALDTNGDGVADCIDLNQDQACTGTDLPVPSASGCASGATTIDGNADGTPDSLDVDCDGVADFGLTQLGGGDGQQDPATPPAADPTGCALAPIDTDDDGEADCLDLNCDGTGDLCGSGGGGQNGAACFFQGIDSDGDGGIDCIDVDCDGAGDTCSTGAEPGPSSPGSATPPSGCQTASATPGCLDLNCDGVPEFCAPSGGGNGQGCSATQLDSDGDGSPDCFDVNCDGVGDFCFPRP
ncbi:MAG: hypothetical protein HY903_12700 [Deltaproteobacteria bacterium]|nr:hypothetical protein [Deltaproteobacteria bacterium]